MSLYASGTQYEKLLYYPWGEVRYSTGSVPTSFRYTGQMEYAAIAGGIMFYGARYYDNSLGRWLSPDSVIPDQYDPQSYDRFAYVRNNPILYEDPSGHFPILPLLLLAAGAFLVNSCSSSSGPIIQDPTITAAFEAMSQTQTGAQYADLITQQGSTITFSQDGNGHTDTNTLSLIEVPNLTTAEIAGTLAHETYQYSNGNCNSLWEEFAAYREGAKVQNEVAAITGNGPTVDMALFNLPFSNIDQKYNDQLIYDWFMQNHKTYIQTWNMTPQEVCP